MTMSLATFPGSPPTGGSGGGTSAAVPNDPSGLMAVPLSPTEVELNREEFCELAVLLAEKMTGTPAAPFSPNLFTDTSNPQVLKAYNPITRQEICA